MVKPLARPILQIGYSILAYLERQTIIRGNKKPVILSQPEHVIAPEAEKTSNQMPSETIGLEAGFPAFVSMSTADSTFVTLEPEKLQSAISVPGFLPDIPSLLLLQENGLVPFQLVRLGLLLL